VSVAKLSVGVSAQEVGLFMLDDLRVSVTFENNNVWVIHWRQVDISNLNNVAMVDLMRRHMAKS
jgi:hypothetical protein